MEFNLKNKPETRQMYETTFIVVPEIPESEYKAIAAKFEKLIKDREGKIINIEHWGQMKFAYPIGRQTSGYYCYIEYSSPGNLIGKLEQEFGYDEKVIRYLTVKLDKHAVEYNNKRRNGEFSRNKTRETQNQN